MLLETCLALLASSSHPDSLSSSRIVVQGAEARLSLRCQVLSLEEVIVGLDADQSGDVDVNELELRREEVFVYISANYRLFVGSDRELQGGRELPSAPVALKLDATSAIPGVGYRKGAVDVELLYSAPAPIEDLLVGVTLFQATSPGHIDIASLEWPDGSVEHFALEERFPLHRSDPTGRGAFGLYLRLGFEHILSGWDHLAFLATLILCARSLRALLGVITAFTAAHSVTLGLAATGLIDVSRFDHLVESMIALSIAYVAADNLLQPELRRARWPEAFVFGLVHGLGFAGFLGASLVNEQARLMGLFSFNLGVELGQALIVVVVVALLSLALGRRERGAFLAPLALRRWGSLALLLAGLYWFAGRL